MKQIFDNLSNQCSRNVTTQYSTSFSIAVKLLSKKIQGDIHSIYGFVRLADEIVDSFQEYDQETLFNNLERDLKYSIKYKISTNPILNSFQHVVHKYNITWDLINAFLNSMKADLSVSVYNSVKKYEEYIYGSADVVGLMCLKVFVNGDQLKYESLKHAAMKLGSAFQKVNFLRDLKEDNLVLKRDYFPQLNGETLNNKSKKIILEEINKDFDEAYYGIRQLPIEARFGVYTAYMYYKTLMHKLKKSNPKKIRESRIRISNSMKTFLLIKSFFKFKFNLI